MNKLFQWMDGFLNLKVYGDSPERFMNLCIKNNMDLRDIYREQDVIFMRMRLKDFYKIRGNVKKAGIRVVITNRNGLPFFIAKTKKRYVFILGLMFCLLFLLIMRKYVWAMDYIGNVTITDDELYNFFQKQGIDYGCNIKSIEFEEVEMKLREEFDSVTWASVGMDGTKFYVYIKETDATTYQQAFNGYLTSDLSAVKAGRIESIVTRNGKPMVKEGDYVSAGTILVSGELPVITTDGTVIGCNYVNADADIIIERDISYYDMIPKYVTQKQYTGSQSKQAVLRAFQWEWCMKNIFEKTENYDSITQYHQCKILDNFYLPFWYGDRTMREYRMISYCRSSKEMSQLLITNMNELIASFIEKGVQIIEKDVKMYDSNVFMECSGRITIRDSCYERTKLIPSEEKNATIMESEINE